MGQFYGIDVEETDSDKAASADLLSFVDYVRAKPSPVNLIRIGEDRDGAYLVPNDLDGIAACFSPGVNNFKYFEDLLLKAHGIQSHMCDFSSDIEKFRTPLIEGSQTFEKKWLDINNDGDNITLASWIDRRAPGSRDLLLQMDIEGAEYRNILGCPDDALRRFRILIFELHGLTRMSSASIFNNVLQPFISRLQPYFTCVHAHPNNCCGDMALPENGIRVPKTLELTFLRNDRFALTSTRHPVMVPHPLDITRNVSRKAPLFLGTGWFVGERPIESRVKILEDRLAFLDYSNGTRADGTVAANAVTVKPTKVAAVRAKPAKRPPTFAQRAKRKLRSLAGRLGLTAKS